MSRMAEHPWIVAGSGAAALLILLIVLFGWTAGVVVVGFIAALVALFKDEFWHWRHAPGLDVALSRSHTRPSDTPYASRTRVSGSRPRGRAFVSWSSSRTHWSTPSGRSGRTTSSRSTGSCLEPVGKRPSSWLPRLRSASPFARDLGVDPDDPAGALDAFTNGIEARIDVAEVNGRLFLNCVSLGIYGEAVRESAYRASKLHTLLETARAVVGPSGEVPELDLVDDLGVEHTHPAVVLVSNNPYGLARPMTRRARPTLAGGRLGIIVLDPPAERRHPPGRAWSATSLEVGAAATVHAGIDGEAVELAPPLEFVIRPAALRVRLLRRDAGPFV